MRDSIGLNGPRMSAGASGFRSNVSNWLGPPNRNRKITDFAFPLVKGAAAFPPRAPSGGKAQQPRPANLQQLPPADAGTRRLGKAVDGQHGGVGLTTGKAVDTLYERHGQRELKRRGAQRERPRIGVGAGMLLPAPPSKPDGRFSRIRLSSQHVCSLMETGHSFARSPCRHKSPRSAK